MSCSPRRSASTASSAPNRPTGIASWRSRRCSCCPILALFLLLQNKIVAGIDGRRAEVAGSKANRCRNGSISSERWIPRATSSPISAIWSPPKDATRAGRRVDATARVDGRRHIGAGGRAPSPDGPAAVFTGDRGSAVDGHGGGVRPLHRDAWRCRPACRARRLGRHGADHAGHARAADRHAQGDGLDRRVGRRRALCRADRHLHDVFGDRHRRAQPHLAAGAGQCRPCARRHDADARARPPGGREAGDRADDVRRHDALRARRSSTAARDRYDCLVFHATGTGGQSMEKLVDSGLLAGVIDVTTTEIADLLVGGVLRAGRGRLGAIVRTGAALCRLGRRARHGQFRRPRRRCRSSSAAAISTCTIRRSR